MQEGQVVSHIVGHDMQESVSTLQSQESEGRASELASTSEASM